MEVQNQDVWSEELSIEQDGFVHVDSRQNLAPSAVPAILPKNQATNGTHSFPIELPDWSNLEVIHRNTLPPRASFFVYDSVEDAVTRDIVNSKTLSLSGTWKFNLSKSPFEAPPDFFNPSYDTSKWGDIKVPGMWQLQGYGKGPQ